MDSRRAVICAAALWCSVQASLGQSCQWRPWAADWSKVNKGTDLYPPNKVFNPTNWDFTFSQQTVLNLIKDVPAGGGTRALHMFWDSQPPSTSSMGAGSGGVYQEVTVTPGVPIQYAFHWKGRGLAQFNWFEFLLIDGPFSPQAADMSPGTAIIRKREVTNGAFGWEQLTSAMPADVGRLQTITPTGSVVTVVLKFGHNDTGAGGAEVFFDSVVVRQNNGPNLLLNGDFENASQGPVCDSELMFQDSTRNNYWFGLTGCPNSQHTLTGVAPATLDNTSNAVLTLSGTHLENMTGARLVPIGGGAEIVATAITPGPGPNATTATVTFPTAGKPDSQFDLVTLQEPLCLTQLLPAAFTLTCAPAITMNAASPATVSPGNPVVITISGTNLQLLTAVALEYMGGSPPAATASAQSLTPSGGDLAVSFDVSCLPAGLYRLVGTRPDVCRPVVLQNAVRLVKSPPSNACAWRPWASAWSKLNTGPDLSPPDGVYNPTNWDYSLSQPTVLDANKDTPPGGGSFALHWFLDAQPPDELESNALGSGGVYQEIAVQPGVPLEYAYWWKAATGGVGTSWFEFMLIDGPFSIAAADLFSESASANNPAMIRKRELTEGGFGWQEVTQATAADVGPAGPRPQTITPTGSTVTVVLKAGRVPAGGMESFWDNVVVAQNGGPNLLVNGTFESFAEASTCEATYMVQEDCEEDYWVRSPLTPPACPVPFGDSDADGDMDMDDFAELQRCLTLTGTVDSGCVCFDRPQQLRPNGLIDSFDVAIFINCAGGPGQEVDPGCGEPAN